MMDENKSMGHALRRLALTAAIVLLAGGFAAPPSAAPPAKSEMDNLLELSDQLDQMDRLDFQTALGKADACVRSREFDCADAQFNKAAKIAHGAKDKNALLAGRQRMLAEIDTIMAEQAALEAERQRQERLAAEAEAEEARRVAQAQQAQREAEEEEEASSNSPGFGDFLGALAQNVAASRGIPVPRSNTINALAPQRSVTGNSSNITARPVVTQPYSSPDQSALQRQREAAQTAIQKEAANNERLMAAARASHQTASPPPTVMPTPAIRPQIAATPVPTPPASSAQAPLPASPTASTATTPGFVKDLQACIASYDGPKDDPQTDGFCQIAHMDQCADRISGNNDYRVDRRAQCSTLDGLLKATGSRGGAAAYCSACR